MPRSLSRRLLRRPAPPLAVTRLEDRATPALFAAAATTSPAGLKNNGHAVAADFNGDGFDDLVLTNYGNAAPGTGGSAAAGQKLTVLLANGAGGFGAPNHLTVGSDQYVSFVAVADVTSDGVPDLVCSSTSGTTEAGNLSVFKGLGGGNFTKLSTQPVGGSNAAWVGVGEFSGDKNPDVVVACFGKSDDNGNNVSGNRAQVFTGDGAGVFAAGPTLTTGIGFIPTTGAVADFDADGVTDLAFGVPGVPSDSNADQPDGYIQYYQGTGAGGFVAGSTPASGGPLPVNMTAADLNADGKPDLVVANAGNPDSNNLYANFGKGTAVGVLINAGFGQFNVPLQLTAGLNSGGSTAAFGVQVADFDLDGARDVVAVTYGHPLLGTKANLAVYLGNGKGAFTPDAASPYQAGTLTGGQFAAVGQFGGSAAPDLAAVGDSNRLAVLVNTSVAPAATTTKLAASANPTSYGGAVTFTATVLASAGTATGSVTFYDGATPLGGPALLDLGGVAVTTVATLGAGGHAITAKYSGGVGFGASTSAVLTQTVNKAVTATTLVAAPSTVAAGGTVTLTATVGSASSLLPTGTVTFFDGATALGGPVAIGADGKAVLPVSGLAVGNHAVTASYAGTANYEPSGSTVVGVTVSPPPPPPAATPTVGVQSSANPSAWGGAVTFTAVVGPGTGSAIPTGSVTFLLNGVATGPAVTLSAAGTAAFTTSTLAVGPATVVAKYSGGTGYNPLDSAAFTQTVNPAAVAVLVTSSAPTATVSLPVTLTANLASSGPGRTGTVTFFDNGAPISLALPVTGSTAAITVSTLGIGVHSITAEFTPATGNFQPGASASFAQTVAAGGVALALTSGGPALVSQPVTLTAALAETPDLPTLAPSGSVTFLLNGVAIGTVPVSGGAAVLTTTGLPVGGGTITAEYAGDANFTVAQAAPLAQAVNKGGVTVALTGGGPATVGQSVTFIATVAETTPLAPDPTGSVVFKLGTQVLATVALSGGSARFTTTTLPAGVGTVTAEYAGDGSFLGATSNPVPQPILAAGSSVTVGTSNSPATVTAAVTLTASVSTAAGPAAGSVQFFAGPAAVSGLILLAGGRAAFVTAALPVGTSDITARFSPSDAAVAPSTSAPLQQQVVRAAPTVTVTADSAPPGLPAAVRAAVAKPTGVTADPAGSVTFRLNGQPVATVPLVNGVATASVMLPAGSANITAEFAGDSNFTTAATTISAGTGPVSRPVGLVGFPQFGVGAGAGRGADAKFFDPTGAERFAVPGVFGGTGGVRVTSADFTGDGVADLVMGTGPGSATRVVVLDGVTKAQVFGVDPFEASFTGGVYVAAGDITGDGVAELIVTPDEGGGPRVRVFNGKGFGDLADFFGIEDANFRGGARAAVGDVDGDGRSEVVVAAGFGGGPRMAVFGGASVADGGTWQRSAVLSAGGTDTRLPRRMMDDFFAFEESLRNGAFVALGDVNGDGFADVIAGGGPGGGPRVVVTNGFVRATTGRAAVIADFFAGDDSNRGGVRVAARDLDGDSKADVVTGNGTGAGSRVSGFSGASLAAQAPKELFGFDAFGGFAGGVYVG